MLVGGIGESVRGVQDGSGVFITNNGMMEFLFNTVVAAPSSGGYGVRLIKVRCGLRLDKGRGNEKGKTRCKSRD